MDLASFTIKEVILHQISQKGGESSLPVLSHTPTPLSDQDKFYVERRIKGALSRRARPIVEEPDTSEVPAIIRRHLDGGDSDLIKNSQELARKLQVTQPTISSPGILIVANAEINGVSALVVAKVEHEEGIRAQEVTTTDGQTTFSVEFLHDLLFTSAGKVYKVAFFSSSDIRENILRGIVADSQATGSSIAQYFLTAYLGCKLAERPEVLTEMFHDGAQKWINSIGDSEKKTRYLVALLSEMQSNRSTLSVDGFAQEYLLPEDRDEFRARMQNESVPLRQIDKSIELVQGSIRKVKIETKSDVLILAPPDALDDGTVTIENTPEGGSEIHIRDQFRRISGSGKFSA